MAKVKIDRELFGRAKQYAERKGYASVEEFVAHVLENAVGEEDEAGESEEDRRKRLEGLGYIG